MIKRFLRTRGCHGDWGVWPSLLSPDAVAMAGGWQMQQSSSGQFWATNNKDIPPRPEQALNRHSLNRAIFYPPRQAPRRAKPAPTLA